MPYTFEESPDEPIVYVTLTGSTNDVQGRAELKEINNKVLEIVGRWSEIVYFVYDLRQMTISFRDVLLVLRDIRDDFKDAGGREFVEANIRDLVVGSGMLLEIGVKALGQAQYGYIEGHLFDTVEEAVAFAREEIRDGQGG